MLSLGKRVAADQIIMCVLTCYRTLRFLTISHSLLQGAHRCKLAPHLFKNYLQSTDLLSSSLRSSVVWASWRVVISTT